jgi:hypothetical protein
MHGCRNRPDVCGCSRCVSDHAAPWFSLVAAALPIRSGRSFGQFDPHFRNKVLPPCIALGEILARTTAMQNLKPHKVALVIALMFPLAAYAQSGGGGSGGGSGGGAGGGGSAGGAASGPSAGTGSAAGSPNAGSAGAGTAGVSGVPSGPANVGGLNNSGNDPSGAGNAAKIPTSPGTNAAGTANSSGAPSSASTGAGSSTSTTTGAAGNRAGGGAGRVDGVTNPGPAVAGDAEINAENKKVDSKIKSICKGC